VAQAAAALALVFCCGVCPVAGAPNDSRIDLVVETGRSLHVRLDERITVKRIGQPVSGTLIEPLYAYDRIVVPAGTAVRGHIAQFEATPKAARIRALLGGDFTSHRGVVLEFDTLVFADGHEVPLRTVVKGGIANVKWRVAGASDKKRTGAAGRARDAAEQKVRDAVSTAKEKAGEAVAALRDPGKMDRLKEMAINRLPYHPQFLRKGFVYDAVLVEPVPFGAADAVERAPAGSAPAPESILTARLARTLDSATTERGTVVDAVLTEPVFSADHRLILPEGTKLTGAVTFVKKARRLKRNGQLRFLFERMQAPEQEPAKMLAALHSVQAGDDAHVVLDDEGGASVTNSKTRFIAPALAVLALAASADGPERHGGDADVAGVGSTTAGGSRAGGGLGGYFGFGLAGVALSRIARPIGVAFAIVGVARTVYSNVLAKGDEVSFPADTPIQLQLAPGPESAKQHQ
jgi:hypothetical protein